MTKQSWYKILAEHRRSDEGSHAEILIYGEIGLDWFGEGIAAEDLVKELADLDVATLDVRINSIGGQVFEGLAIFNALDRHPATVTTHVDGMAASIASIVALAGDEVRIAENAFMMIHNAWGIEIGDSKAMLKRAEILEALDGGLADTYMAKTGESAKVIREMMDVETWFNAEEALAVGLVDEISAKMEIAASFDLSKFHNVRDDVLERAAAQVQPEEKADLWERAREAAARADKSPSDANDRAAASALVAAALEDGTTPDEITARLEAGVAELEAEAATAGEGPSSEELLQLSIETARTLADTRL